MSKQSDDALHAIERIVFKSLDPVVVALTGGWGEGKTFFWKEVIVPAHADTKPGYISVFGAESLAVIRERICLATFPEPKLDGHKRAKEAGGAIVRSISGVLGWLAGKIGAPDTLAVEILQAYRLNPGWIICIDDVERLSEKVGYENFLGYVAELRDRWKLKVVLIFNKGRISDKPVFQLYQEKVIDREIPFALDFDEVVGLVFRKVKAPGLDVSAEAHTRAKVLGLRNIRILVKARSYFQEMMSEVPGANSVEFIQSAFASILLFTYVKFSGDKPSGLSFDMLATYNDWTDRFRKKFAASNDEDEDDEQKKSDPAKELLERYPYAVTDDLDRVLMEFVQTDVLDADRLRAIYSTHISESSKARVRARFRDVWDTEYHGKFEDNAQQLSDAVEGALSGYLPFIPPGELDFALVVLTALGRDQAAKRFFDEFTRTRGATFEGLAEDAMPNGPFEYPPMKEYFDSIVRRQSSDTRSVEEVLAQAFNEQFVSQRDIDRINGFSPDDLVKYFISHPQPKLTLKLKKLLKDGDPELRKKVRAAAEKIADMSPLNRMRLEGMGIVKPQQSPAAE